MDLDTACHRAAATSYGVVTREGLLDLGMSADQVSRRLRAGVLVRLQPAVYAVASAPERFEQRVLAACLAAGPGAAASHRSAARLWGLRGATSDRLEITVPGVSRPRLAHVTVHRSRLLEPVEVRRSAGIPVTRPEGTLVDCAVGLRAEVVAGLVESTVLAGLTTVDRLWRYLSRCQVPGAGVLRAVLEVRTPGARPTESGLEDRTLAVLRRFGSLLRSASTRSTVSGWISPTPTTASPWRSTAPSGTRTAPATGGTERSGTF